MHSNGHRTADRTVLKWPALLLGLAALVWCSPAGAEDCTQSTGCRIWPDVNRLILCIHQDGCINFESGCDPCCSFCKGSFVPDPWCPPHPITQGEYPTTVGWESECFEGCCGMGSTGACISIFGGDPIPTKCPRNQVIPVDGGPSGCESLGNCEYLCPTKKAVFTPEPYTQAEANAGQYMWQWQTWKPMDGGGPRPCAATEDGSGKWCRPCYDVPGEPPHYPYTEQSIEVHNSSAVFAGAGLYQVRLHADYGPVTCESDWHQFVVTEWYHSSLPDVIPVGEEMDLSLWMKPWWLDKHAAKLQISNPDAVELRDAETDQVAGGTITWAPPHSPGAGAGGGTVGMIADQIGDNDTSKPLQLHVRGVAPGEVTFTLSYLDCDETFKTTVILADIYGGLPEETEDQGQGMLVYQGNPNLSPVHLNCWPPQEGGTTYLSLYPSGEGQIRVWLNPNKTGLLLDRNNGSVSWPVLQMPHTVYVEGVEAGRADPNWCTAQLTLSYALRGATHRDYLNVTVLEAPIVDIAVGGVRDGHKDPPRNGPPDDPTENDPPCPEIIVNTDDDDGNGVADKDDLAETGDWAASEMVEARIRVTQEVPWRLHMNYGGAGQVRIWRTATKQPGSEIVPDQWQTWQPDDNSLAVYVEGTVASSAPGDIHVQLQADLDGDGAYSAGEPLDEICTTAKTPDCDIAVDLDIDANNDGTLQTGDGDEDDDAEDGVGPSGGDGGEGNPPVTGKIVVVNDDDDDWDGIVDYFDGYNWDGISGNADDATQDENELVPMKLTLRGQDSLDGWSMWLDYPYADPWYPWDWWDWWTRGHVRVWLVQPGPVAGRTLLPPGAYNLADLGVTSGHRYADLAVEGITVSLRRGDVPITVSMFGPATPNGPPPTPKVGMDRVRVTVINGEILVGASDPNDRSRADDWVGFERGIARSVLLLYGPQDVTEYIGVQMGSRGNPMVDPRQGTVHLEPTDIPDGVLSQWNPHSPGAQYCYFYIHGVRTSAALDDVLITAGIEGMPFTLAEAPVTVLEPKMFSPTCGTGLVPLNPAVICPNLPLPYYNLFGTSRSVATFIYDPPDPHVPKYCMPDTRALGCHLRHDVIETGWVRVSPSYTNAYGTPVVERLTRISPMPNDAGEMTNFRVDGQVPALPGTTPQGTTWYIRFCHPSLMNDPHYPLSGPDSGWVSQAEAKQYDLVTYPLKLHVCGSLSHPAPSLQEAQELADGASWIWSQAGITFNTTLVQPESISDGLMELNTGGLESELRSLLAINNATTTIDSYLVRCIMDAEGAYSGGITSYPSFWISNKGTASSYFWGFFDTQNLSEQARVRYRLRTLAHEIGHHIMDRSQEELDGVYLMYNNSSDDKRYISLDEALRVRNQGPLPSNPDHSR